MSVELEKSVRTHIDAEMLASLLSENGLKQFYQTVAGQTVLRVTHSALVSEQNSIC